MKRHEHDQPAPEVRSGNAAVDRRHRRYLAAAVLVAALAWAGYVHCTAPVLPFDDAFITYRYADHFVRGKGLVYNEGQRVFGSTTPLYLLVLIVLKGISPAAAVPDLAVRFNLIPHALCGLAAYLALRRFTANRLLAAVAAAAILVESNLLTRSVGGMESAAFSALLLLTVLAAAATRPAWTGVLAGLACLTRPEGVLLIPLAVIVFARSRWRLLLAAGACAATLLPWVVFAWIYYGSPVPLSLIAKSRPLYPLPPGHALERTILRLGSWSIPVLPRHVSQAVGAVILATVLACLIACLASRIHRSRGAWMPGAIFWGFLGLYAVGNPLVFDWYLPPVWVCATVAVAAGVPAAGALLSTQLERRGRKRLASRARQAAVVGTASALAIVALGPYALGISPALIISNDPMRVRTQGYRKAAEQLNAVCSESDTLAAPEVGSLGYYYKGRVLDACGLVSPEAFDFLPVPPSQRIDPTAGAISVDFVKHTRPDYVVAIPAFTLMSLGRSPWFAENYELMATAPLPIPCFQSTHVEIFQRKRPRP